jgi:hypothetical protein
MADLTAAVDDVATTRWQRCTFCSGPLSDFSFRVWQSPAGVVVGVVLCGRCVAIGDPVVSEAVAMMLKRRYDPQRFGQDDNGGAREPNDRQ